MRPNNQNKRSRGRNGGRKQSNPLSRNFESNGPDVKVRGNASHVAEKYVQLARDAQASGDSVMAENYLQHAEHYFRIISAAQAQMAQRNDQSQSSNDDDDDNDSDATEARNEDAPKKEEAAAKSTDGSADEAQDGGEDKAERKPRRPRRKRTADPAAASAGEGPQPELGELPAFLTSGTASAAE